MPVVESSELVNKVHHSGHFALRVITHDLLIGKHGRDAVTSELALNEAVHTRGKRPIRDGSVVGGKGAVELKVVAGDRVVRVICHRVEIFKDAAPFPAARVRHVLRVAEGSIVDNVVKSSPVHAAKNVVVCTVLQQDPDNVLNLVFQVGNGGRRARSVSKGLAASSKARAGQAEEGCQGARLHCACSKSNNGDE